MLAREEESVAAIGLDAQQHQLALDILGTTAEGHFCMSLEYIKLSRENSSFSRRDELGLYRGMARCQKQAVLATSNVLGALSLR